MAKTHVVAEGECLSSIAFDHGFSVETLWNLPENAALKSLRKNPVVLMAGDRVFIPDRRPKDVSCRTGGCHRFRRKGVPARFQLRLMDGAAPRANLEYELEIDGVITSGRTGGDGSIVENISPGASVARLRVRDGETVETFTLLLGHIDPLSEPSGVRARLRALGFFAGPEDDAAALGRAVTAFQKQHGLPVSGEVDDALREKLAAEFGA